MNIFQNYDYAYLFFCGRYTYDTWTGKDLLKVSLPFSEYKNNDLVNGSNFDETVYDLKYIYDYEKENPYDNMLNPISIEEANRKYFLKKYL